MTLVRTARN